MKLESDLKVCSRRILTWEWENQRTVSKCIEMKVIREGQGNGEETCLMVFGQCCTTCHRTVLYRVIFLSNFNHILNYETCSCDIQRCLEIRQLTDGIPLQKSKVGDFFFFLFLKQIGTSSSWSSSRWLYDVLVHSRLWLQRSSQIPDWMLVGSSSLM